MSETVSILEESAKSKLFGGVFKRLTLPKVIGFVLFFTAVILSAWYFFLRGGNESQTAQAKQEIWIVKKDNVRVSIEADGKVVADDMVALSYPVTGVTLNKVYVKEGQQVARGDLIASMDTGSNQFDLRSAQNSYQSALNNLQLKLAPPTDEQIASAKASIEQAEISLEQTKISIEQTKMTAEQNIANAERSVETAKNNLLLNQDAGTSQIVQNAYENLFNAVQSAAITISNAISKSDEILGIDNEARSYTYRSYIGALDSGSYDVAKLSYNLSKIQKNILDMEMTGLTAQSEHQAIQSAADTAKRALESLQTHYLDLQRVLDYSMTGKDLTQAQLDSFRSSVSSMRSTISSGFSSISSARQNITTAQNSLANYTINYQKALADLESAKKKSEQDLATSATNLRARELALDQVKLSYETLIAPPREIDLMASRISVENAKVSLDRVMYNISQATLISPIEGEIVILNGKEGDLISKDNSGVFAQILNKDTMFIQVKIEEADINKIKVAQKAYVTFDAIEDVIINGEVSFVSVISEQSANGITSYLVRVLLDQEGTEGIREGMTAFVEFAIAEANNVLVVPVSAVKNVNGKPSVQSESGEWLSVVTGFTNGKIVEIISGLKEGDKILITSSSTVTKSAQTNTVTNAGMMMR
jgi:HlyD family secretion protein